MTLFIETLPLSAPLAALFGGALFAVTCEWVVRLAVLCAR
jgi:hypothetical protein